RPRHLPAVVRLELEGVFVPGVTADREPLIRPANAAVRRKSMRTTIVMAAILIAAARGIAAGGHGVTSTSTQSAPAALDPCTLMTRQDAATAVGEAVGEPKKKDPGRSAGPGMTVVQCEYTSAARNSINLTIWGFSGESAAMGLQIYKSECLKKEQ